MWKKRSAKGRAVALSRENVAVLVLKNPRAQVALSSLIFFLALLISAFRSVVFASLHNENPLLLQFSLGFLLGFFMIVALYFSQRIRSQSRFRRAVATALMTELNPDILGTLMPLDAVDHICFTDFQKVNWLNKELAKVWPFLGEAISNLVKEQLQSILDDYKSAVIENLFIRTLWLGVSSPTLEGVKLVDSCANEAVLEAIFTLQTNKENVVIDLRTNGPEFTIKVSDIHIAGMLKLVFKPLREALPGFGAILVSLLEDPDMGYDARFIGGDIKALPGVQDMITDTIKTSIQDVLVWPNRYVYPVSPGDYSYLELRPTGLLDVSLIEATDLMNTDIVGKSDPFVLLYVRRKKERVKRSSTKKNTLHPVWNEGFYIEVDDKNAQCLTIRMMDEESIEKEEFMGEAKFPLHELKDYEPKDVWLDLVYSAKASMPQKSRGRAHLLLIYRPFGGDKQSNDSA